MYIIPFILSLFHLLPEVSDSAKSDLLVWIMSRKMIKEYESENQRYHEGNAPQVYQDSVYYYSDVEPIIAQNCIFCHNENGNAPFDLTGYVNLKKRSPVVKLVLKERIMPPWLADYHYSDLFNAPAMTDHERSVVITWIENGCEKGNIDHYPQAAGALEFESPDLELVLPQRHTVTSDDDTYQCFMYEVKVNEPKYLTGVEFLSDNPEVIHHMMLYLDTCGIIESNVNSWNCKNDGVVNKLFPIQSWSRGMRPFRLNNKLGYRLKSGDRFLLQTHYGDEGNKGRKERTTLRLHFTDSVVSPVNFEILNKLDILYPPDTIMVEHMVYEVKDSISLLGVIPHSHFLVRKMECFAITPDNRQIQLLRIPDWDYLWQGQCMFRHPQIIPKGSTIYFFELIDNTERNPYQPNDPVREVRYATNSNDEMFTVVLLNKTYEKGDESMKVGYFLNQIGN